MNRLAYAHPQQRSSRLWHGDTLFQLVERIPYPTRPEPIPVGQAREIQIPGLAELVKRRASA